MVNVTIDTQDTSEVEWGIEAQTGVLTDVLLGKPDHFRWVPLNSISAVTLANQEHLGLRLDSQKAMQQHQRMVECMRPMVFDFTL